MDKLDTVEISLVGKGIYCKRLLRLTKYILKTQLRWTKHILQKVA